MTGEQANPRPLWADRGIHVSSLIAAALAAVDPAAAVRRTLRREGNRLWVADQEYALNERVFVVGGGKAGAPMAAAATEILGPCLMGGIVVVKRGHVLDTPIPSPIEIIEAGHPVPDEAGVSGAGRIAHLLADTRPEDLVIALLSGGGSALLTLPVAELSLGDYRALTDALLRSGATINEMNAVRKHLSRLAGGNLARLAAPSRVAALILSDVVGDPLDVIASGPTSPDPTTFADAYEVLTRHEVLGHVPQPIITQLWAGMAGQVPETPKRGDPVFERVQNVIVASNRLAAEAAARRANSLGFHTALLTTFLEGEAREVARAVAAMAKEMVRNDRPLARPACLVLGGETTVTVHGEGRGGRNQELALAAALALDGWPRVQVLPLATDGNDGPTDAAGAAVSGETVTRARELGLEASRYLADNNSYPFFEALGDLIRTGPTNTNVNDLLFVLAYGDEESEGGKI